MTKKEKRIIEICANARGDFGQFFKVQALSYKRLYAAMCYRYNELRKG